MEPAVYFLPRLFYPGTPALALGVPPLILALEAVPAPACLHAPDSEVPSILSALSQCLALTQRNVSSLGCLTVLGVKMLASGSKQALRQLERCLPGSEHHVGFVGSSWHAVSVMVALALTLRCPSELPA